MTSDQAPESSDQPEPTPAPSTGAADEVAGEGKSKSARTRRQRWVRRLLWLVVLVVVFRISVAVSVPIVIDKVLDHYGLTCEYESLDLSLLGADAELWNFRLQTSDGSVVYADTEYCRADLSVFDLFRGRLVVRRLECDGVDLFLERDGNGDITLLRHFQSHAAAEEKPVEAAEEEVVLRDLKIDAPLQLKALRLQHAHVHFTDASVVPQQSVRLVGHIRLSHFGDAERPARFELELAAPDVLPRLVMEGTSQFADNQLDASFSARIDSLAVDSLGPYLREAGVDPRSRQLSGRFQGSLKLSAEPRLTAELALSDLDLLAAEEQPVRLRELRLVAALSEAAEPLLVEFAARGGELSLQRHDSGAWSCAGIELGSRAAPATPVAGPALPPAAEDSTAPTVVRDTWLSLPFVALNAVEQVTIEDCNFRVVDALATDAPALGVGVRQLSLERLADGEELAALLTGSKPTHRLVVAASIPGIVENASADGRVELLRDRIAFACEARADQLSGGGLQPYLSKTGVDLDLAGGALRGSVEGSVALRDHLELLLAARDLHLLRGEELVGLDEFELSATSVNPFTREMRVGRLVVAGVHLEARRDADGTFSIPGVTYAPIAPDAPIGPDTKAAQLDPSSADAAAVAQSTPWPVQGGRPWLVEFGEVVVDAKGVRFDDATTEAPPLTLNQLGLQLADVTMSAPYPSRPGSVRAVLEVPGLVGLLELRGDLDQQRGAQTLTGEVSAKDLSLQPLLEYLPADVVRSVWSDAEAHCDLTLALEWGVGVLEATESQLASGIAATVDVRDMQLREGAESLFRCQQVELIAAVAPGHLHVSELTIDSPEVEIILDEGSVSALGIDVNVAPEGASTATAVAAEPAVAPQSPLDIALPNFPSTRIQVGRLALESAALRWRDARVDLSGTLVADAALEQLDTSTASPARIEAALRSDRFFDAATLRGELGLSPSAQRVSATGVLEGLRGTEVSAILPDGVAFYPETATAEARFEAALGQHPEGGHSASVSVNDILLEERAGEPRALCSVEEVGCAIGRWDPKARVYSVERIAGRGLRASGRRNMDGSLSVAGLTLRAVPSEASTQQISPAGPTASAAPPAQAAAATERNTTPPRFEIMAVDLGIAEFTFQDMDGAEPVRIADLSLRSVTPWSAQLAADADPPALELALVGSVEPLVAELGGGLTFAPFAAEPSFRVLARVNGIEGDRFAEVLPSAQPLDLSPLGQGAFQAEFKGRWTSPRRGPLDWNLRRPIEAVFEVSDLHLTNSNGIVVAGVDGVLVDGVRFDASARKLQIATVEVNTPRGRVFRDAESLQAAGVELLALGGGAQERDAVEQSAVEQSADEHEAADVTRAATTESSGWQVAVEQLFVDGLDFEIEDRTGEQPAVLPLRSLGFAAQNIALGGASTRPLRFDMLLGAGADPSTDALAEQRSRPWLREVIANGVIHLGDQPEGRVRLQVGALDLLSLTEPAAASGVTIGGGAFDSRIDLQLRETQELELDSEFVFSDLDLQEPDEGPIARYLKLPLSLQPAIFLLRDETGAVRVPVQTTVSSDGIGVAQIAAVLAATTAQVIADAIASSPLRVAGTMTDLVGVTGEEQDDIEVAVAFSAGEVAWEDAGKEAIAAVVDALDGDSDLEVVLTHSAGSDDLDQLAQRVTPTEAERTTLLGQLRQRRVALDEQRAGLVRVAADATLVSIDRVASEARAKVQELDADLGQIEQAIDRLVDAGDDPAPHRVSRQLRHFAIELGAQRLAALQQAIVAAGVDEEQIRWVRPRAASAPEATVGSATLSVRRVVAGG